MATRSSSARRPLAPRWTRERLIVDAVVLAWGTVLLLWAANVWRSASSVVFLLGAASAIVYLLFTVVDVSKEQGLFRGLTASVCLSLLLLVPIAFDPTSFDVFNITKYTLVICGAIAIAGLWIIRRVIAGEWPAWRNGLHWPVIALLAWTLITTFTSINLRVSLLGFYKSYDGLFSILAMMIIFFAIADALSIKDVKRALSVFFIGGGGLAVLYGFMQLHDRTFPGDQWDWVPWGSALFRSAIWATFGNPNHLAGFLAVMLPIGVTLLFVHRDWRVRALIAAIDLVLILELLQTTTRGAWLATIVSAPVLLALLWPDIKARPKVALSLLGLLIAGLAAAAIVLGSASAFGKQLGSVLDFSGASTATQRIELWKSAAEIGGERPIFGFGPDTYRLTFPSYQTAKFVDLYGPNQIANGPHNTFLNYLATQGFPGLFLFIAVITYAGLRALGAWRRFHSVETSKRKDREWATESRLLLVGAMTALVAYLVQGSFNVQQIGLSFAFWGLLGIVCVIATGAGVPNTLRPLRLLSATHGEPVELQPAERKPAQRRRERRSPVASVATIAVTSLAALVLMWNGSAPYRADHVFLEAQGDKSRASIEDFSAGLRGLHLRLSRAELEEAIAINPWEAAYMEQWAVLTFNRGQQVLLGEGVAQNEQFGTRLLDDAATMYERAIDLQPQNSYLLDGYARVLLKINEFDPENTDVREAGIDELREAVRINPWEPDFAALLAATLANQGDLEEAREVIESALSYRPDDDELNRISLEIESLQRN